MFDFSESHYTLVENPNHPLHGVKFLKGDWKDVTVVYGQVSIKESEELDFATLSFNFQIMDPGDFTIDELESDEIFKNYLGDVLKYIISTSIETGEYRIGNNESTTNSYTESSSQ